MSLKEFKFPLIIFDSECPLCVRFTQRLKLLDSKSAFRFESLYNEDLYQIFSFLSFDQCKEEVHLILNDKEVLRGPEVVEFLIKSIPGVKKISWLIDSKAGKNTMNSFYKKLNSMRLKKKQGCRSC